MFLGRRWWWFYTVTTLGLFGSGVFFALVAGQAVWFAVGGMWAFSLMTWARFYRERRRGWKVSVRERNGRAQITYMEDRRGQAGR